MDVTVTVRSTTGTAPLHITRISPSLVQITDEQGATQIYRVTEIQEALKDEGNKK